MPFRIKEARYTGPAPILHLWDERVHLHLQTELDSGVVRLWVGHDWPWKASVHVTIAEEYDGAKERDLIRLEGVDSPNKREVHLIATKLAEMGFRQKVIDTVLQDVWTQARGYDQDEEVHDA